MYINKIYMFYVYTFLIHFIKERNIRFHKPSLSNYVIKLGILFRIKSDKNGHHCFV